MKKRLLWFLMLIFWWLAFYGLYYYYFVLNVWTLIVTSNKSNFNIEIKNSTLNTIFKYECSNYVCRIDNLAPLRYELIWKVDLHHDIIENIMISRKTQLNINLNFQREVILEKIKNDDQDSSSRVDVLRNITSLQREKYRFFDTRDWFYYYFEDLQDNRLLLKRTNLENDVNIYTFMKVPRTDISLHKVYNIEDILFISMWNKKYIFDLSAWEVYDFVLNADVNYVKYYNNIYNINTNKWSFLFNKIDDSVNYFFPFRDFVSLNSREYLAIIDKDDLTRKQRYWLWWYNWNLVVRYNLNTKNVSVIRQVDFSIEKILKIWEDFFFYDTNNNKYQISNI